MARRAKVCTRLSRKGRKNDVQTESQAEAPTVLLGMIERSGQMWAEGLISGPGGLASSNIREARGKTQHI